MSIIVDFPSWHGMETSLLLSSINIIITQILNNLHISAPTTSGHCGIAAKTAFKVQKEMTRTGYIRVVIEAQTIRNNFEGHRQYDNKY